MKKTTTLKLTETEIEDITYALRNYRQQVMSVGSDIGYGFTKRDIDFINKELAGRLSELIKTFEVAGKEIWNKIGRGE